MFFQVVTDLQKSSIFIEKNLHINGPVQFKPVLFKGQLCYYQVAKEKVKAIFQRISIFPLLDSILYHTE